MKLCRTLSAVRGSLNRVQDMENGESGKKEGFLCPKSALCPPCRRRDARGTVPRGAAGAGSPVGLSALQGQAAPGLRRPRASRQEVESCWSRAGCERREDEMGGFALAPYSRPG